MGQVQPATADRLQQRDDDVEQDDRADQHDDEHVDDAHERLGDWKQGRYLEPRPIYEAAN